jgi:hypothetical protein
MPLIGEVEPGVWIACAFGKHGINTASMAGDLIARAIVEGDDRWRLFAPFELVWAGGSWGRAAAQVLIWSSRLRHGIAEMLARRSARAEQAARETAENLRRARARARRRAMLRMAPATAPEPPNAPAEEDAANQAPPVGWQPDRISGPPVAP